MKTDGQTFSEIYIEIEEALWSKAIGERTELTRDGFRAACKIMMEALLDKMWEKQERENMPFPQRLEMVKYFGESFGSMIKQATGIDPKKLYK
jgi:hypothetical protein